MTKIQMHWPILNFSPINLWNSPSMNIKKDILDKIDEEILRYFIKYKGKFPEIIYLGELEYNELLNIISSTKEIKLQIIKVKKETYLKVG